MEKGRRVNEYVTVLRKRDELGKKIKSELLISLTKAKSRLIRV